METKPQRVPLDLDNPAPGTPVPHSSVGQAFQPDTVPDQAGKPDLPSTGPVDVGEMEEKIITVLRTCYDPEIPVNIYEMGLIYDLDIAPSGDVVVRMTLTSPACPVAGSLPPDVQAKVAAIPGVKSARVDLVWEPPWTPERMSEAARLELGMF